MVNIGRNDPCPCGKLKTNSLPIKYKKCCLLKTGTKSEIKKERVAMFRDLMISRPFTVCPKCGNNSFGISICSYPSKSFAKECKVCHFVQTFPLPDIKKKIIYVDQFAYDNFVKTLDRKHPKHQKSSSDPFWLELYKKLEIVTRAQLVICPDSFYHKEESSYTNYFPALRRIYEHFSDGITFLPVEKIIEQQILEHFKNYLAGSSEIEPSTSPENIAFGDKLHEWRSHLGISVSSTPKKDEIDRNERAKKEKYSMFLEVFDRWKKRKAKK